MCVQTKTFCIYNNRITWFILNLRKLRQGGVIQVDKALYKQA